MEDVQKALRELGLNRDEVTLEKLSELEWKLGEIKFGLDDVDAAGVLLGAMHFNAPLSPSTGQTNGNGGMRFASATPLPSKHVRSSSSCSSSSACSYSPGRDMPGARDGGEATAAAEGAETTNSNGTGTTPGTSNAARNTARKYSAPEPATGALGAAAGPAAASARKCGAAAARNSEGTVGMDAVFAGMHRERLRKAAYNREYQAAVTAFSKMDQNSGRVSTPAFEDLLELLCIPEARRRGDATESARAAGLLSSYSFSCVEFTVWYLEWFFRPEADGSTKPAANGAPSAKSETRSRGSRPPSPSIPCISRWRRAQEAGSSSSSSEGSSSPTPNLTSSHSAKVDMFSGLGSVPRVQVKEGLEAAMAAASASPEPTDSEESNYLRFGLSGGQEELNRLRGLHLDGGHKAEASKAKAAVPSTASKRRESAEAVVAAAASLRATVTAQTAGHSTDGSSSNSESSEFSVGRRGMRSIPQRRRGEDTASPGERSEGSGNTVLSGLASEDSAAERRRSEEDEARIRVDLANAYVPFKSQAPATQAPRAAGVVPRPGGSPLLSPAGTQRPGQFSFGVGVGVGVGVGKKQPASRRQARSGTTGDKMSKSAHRGVSSGDASSRLTRGPAFGSDTTRPVGTGRQSPADMMDVSEPPSDPGFVFQTRQQEVPTPTTQSAPLPAATARPTPPVAAASPGAASSFVFGPTPSKSVANGAAPAAPTQSPFGSPPPLSTATPVRFEFSGGVRPVQPTSPEQKPPAGESSSRPGILPPAFSFGPKKAGWTPTPRPPASPNRKGAMFATGAPPTDQRENTRKTRGRRGQRGRPTSGSSPTPPPPPGRRDWHVNADSMKGGMGNSTGAVGANGFWGPWAGTFKSGVAPAESAGVATTSSENGFFSSVFASRRSPLNPQSRAASASSSSAKTSTADSASGGTGPSHATSQEAGDMSAGPLGPISDGESILPDATAAPSTPKSVAARGVGGGGNGPFSVMSPPPPSSAASSRASAYFTPEGRNAAMGTASASQNRGNRGGSTNTNFSQSLPRSLWNIAGSPSTGDPGGGGDPGPGGTIDEMDGETTAPTKPPTGSWFSSCVDADFEPSPLSAAASPAPAAPFGGDSSASNGGVRFTFGVASPSGADSAGVQANGKADGYTSCATRMGVGSGGKAVPAQKVNPPRFAFGEQARRSEVGGGDGGNDSFAQKFMQHQREHRREQEGSEGRGYSQPAAGCETVPPPAPRGTGFSFGQASPAPSTSTRGSGKRRASTRNLLKKPQPQQQQQTRQGVASSIAMDKDGTAAQASPLPRPPPLQQQRQQAKPHGLHKLQGLSPSAVTAGGSPGQLNNSQPLFAAAAAPASANPTAEGSDDAPPPPYNPAYDVLAAISRNIGRNASAASAAAGGTVASGVGGGVSGGGSVGGGADAIMQAWLRGKEAEAQREREEKQKAAREQQQRLEAAAKLDRLRKRHEADKESARRTYMDKCFEAASVEYTTAIASLEELLQHVAAHGDGRGPGGGKPIPGDGGRGRLAPLYWSRAAAHIMSGRYRSAVIDCSMALNAEPEWAQAYPRMGKALLMAGDLHGADEAFKKGTMDHPRLDDDVRRSRECRLGMANVNVVKVHLDNAEFALRGKELDRAIDCCDRALLLSPNNIAAQRIILEALLQRWQWDDARTRCELWAYKRDTCDCTTGMISLAGFAEGGGPPRACLQAMASELREGYCKSLRNGGHTDLFKEALDEATMTGAPWAVTMTRKRRDVMDKKERAGKAYATNRYRSAHELYTEAIQVDPEDYHTNALLYANRAAAFMNLARNNDALKDCQEALRLKPDYPKVLLRKARLHKRLSQWAEAIKDFESYRNMVGVLHESWQDAAYELDQCRMCQRRAQEDQRRAEAEARRRERRYFGGGERAHHSWFENDYYPTDSEDEEEHGDPFGGFYGPFTGAGGSGRASRGNKTSPTGDSASASAGMAPTGHYLTLGIACDATMAEVKKAYRKLALQHHPDKNQGDEVSAERFKEVTAAYEVLSDDQERRSYDATLRLSTRSSRWR